MTVDPRSVMLGKNRPRWLADGDANRIAELAPEQRGPRTQRRNIFRLTKRFDWSELWAKVWG